jgi:hypothetical protein
MCIDELRDEELLIELIPEKYIMEEEKGKINFVRILLKKYIFRRKKV